MFTSGVRITPVSKKEIDKAFIPLVSGVMKWGMPKVIVGVDQCTHLNRFLKGLEVILCDGLIKAGISTVNNFLSQKIKQGMKWIICFFIHSKIEDEGVVLRKNPDIGNLLQPIKHFEIVIRQSAVAADGLSERKHLEVEGELMGIEKFFSLCG